MRTTGVRTAPHPTPRPTHPPHSLDGPKPLPRTKFLQKSTSQESPSTAILRSAPPPPVPVRSQSLPSKVPPPKPPRTLSVVTTTTRHYRPGLMEILSCPNPISTTSASSTPVPLRSTNRPRRPPPPQRQGKTTGATAVSPQHLSHPQQPFSTPSPPTTTIQSRVPSFRSFPVLQLSPSRISSNTSQSCCAPPFSSLLQTGSDKQSSVCSVDDFEDTCKKVFSNTRRAKELSTRGKYVQAASHYQVALTALDHVLRAQVLSLSQHESTRQRLFLQQQQVFNLRKEALNGFTDAQTAVQTPRGLSPTSLTPGAPPSYDEVLEEDHRRLQDDSSQSSTRLLLTQERTTSRTHQDCTQSNTNPPPTQGSSTRVRSHSSGESKIEEQLNVRSNREKISREDMAPHSQTCMRQNQVSATRPKSSYHPLNQSDPSTSHLPSTAAVHNPSLPPPLQPVSLHPSPVFVPHTSLSPLPVLDEAVLSQMRVLQVYESGTSPHSHSHKDTTNKNNSHDMIMGINNDRTLQVRSVQNDSGRIAKLVKDEVKSNSLACVSPIDDPFLRVDPFPLVKPRSADSVEMFSEEIQRDSQTQNVSQAFTDDFDPEISLNADQESINTKVTQNSFSPSMSQNSGNLGDSILEALDVAVPPRPGNKRMSPQYSKQRGTTCYYSEENLLDVSHNTLEFILHSTSNKHGSRASIIEEFDPLLTCHTPPHYQKCNEERNQDEEEVCEEERETCRQKGQSTDDVPFIPTPQTLHKSCLLYEDTSPTMVGEREGDIDESPPDYYIEGGAIALGGNQRGVVGKLQYPGALGLSEGMSRRMSSSSEDFSSMNTLLPEYSARKPSEPASLLNPCLYPHLLEEEEEEGNGEQESIVDVGHSAFYLPPTTQGKAMRKNLLNIREGVKIYFIHTDDVVTSPWNKPVLTVSRDPSKEKLFSSGLMLSVGNNLWVCELHKKSTLVLRTQTGGYVFSEVAGRPQCKAVAIRVPSGVRRAQQELLSGVLQQHTMLEEERPKGITKAISKSASSAATRMNKLVEDESMTTIQTFVRRNSIRALKGVSKRLTSIAERTGATLKELPEEYQKLQEAADTLTFALSAKMIQYI